MMHTKSSVISHVVQDIWTLLLHAYAVVNIPTNLQARYDLFCVKSAVKPQPTVQIIMIIIIIF